ncbi:PTS transporter subunit IIC [Nosocomiicoccus massiliensis]|uniref:PTS transporter subunit IIC n=1 Tax=Nosocomiicoccus massiliensis TaxID=1232430 RepID=UPI00041945FF|nr:PTS sugar transporter subunit IIC [Nosocomiicoccus massiliensis]
MKMSKKDFFFNILNGMAIGIVVALVTSALLGEILKFFGRYSDVFITVGNAVSSFQLITSVIIGVLAGMNLKFDGIRSVILGGAALIGSGALVFEETGVRLQGMGDLINVLITLIIAAAIIVFIGDKLGSLNIVFLPFLGGVVPGLIGLMILPYSKLVTTSLGELIAHFTDLNPLLMTILICVFYSAFLATPISLVAIATVVSLSGLASGAANLGILTACMTFLFGSIGINNKGTIIALIIGTGKMMMPVYFKNPIIAVPLVINGIIVGATGYFMNVQGTPMSAGFGHTGLVGPINSLALMDGSTSMNIAKLTVAYLIVPVIAAFIVDKLCLKFLPKYTREMFLFKP